MRYMVDSTNINDEPDADLVAYYCDGEFAVSGAAVRARFPNAILVPVSAVGTNAGIVGDCEPGCMTEDELVTWVVERRVANVDPTGYVNELHGWVTARAAFARRGVREPHWWVADYDGLDVIPPGAVAKQDKNSAMTGGHFDKSVVADTWPGVDGSHGDPTNFLGENMNVADLKYAFIRLAYLGALGREPESAAVQIEQASHIADDLSNVDNIISEIADSPEGVAYRAKLKAALGASAPDLSSITATANAALDAATKATAAVAAIKVPTTGTIAGPISVTLS